jgi:hypothetical protein
VADASDCHVSFNVRAKQATTQLLAGYQ